jgi:cytochrome c553
MKSDLKNILILASVVLVAGNAIAADVNENWAKNCTICHGRDGSGNTVMGKRNNVKDYRDAVVQAAIPDSTALTVIKDGSIVGGKERMKGYKAIFTPEEINSLVEYFRKCKQ